MTVIYNPFRMYDVKNKFYSTNYKIVTAPYSKTVLQNRRRLRVINNRFCSSENVVFAVVEHSYLLDEKNKLHVS